MELKRAEQILKNQSEKNFIGSGYIGIGINL